MAMSGSSPNDSPKPVISSPWSQVVAAVAPSSSRSPPPVIHSSVVNSTPVEDSDKAVVGHNVNSGKRPALDKSASSSSFQLPPPIAVDSSIVNSAPAEDSDKAVVGHNVTSGKRPAWNKSGAASSSRSPQPTAVDSSVVNSTPVEDSGKAAAGHNRNSGKRPAWNKLSNAASSSVMGADSWPALTDSTRAPARSPSESVKVSVDVPSSLQLQGTPNMFPSSTSQRTITANMNNMASQIHPRPFRHTNSHLSSSGIHPSQLLSPQGTMVPPVSHNYNRGHQPRPGFVPNDHPQQRNSSRNRNVVPHQRGDGAHHHTGPHQHQRGDGPHHHSYGNRRDEGHWNTHQNFNVRENYVPPIIAPPQYTGPPPPIITQLFPPPPPPPPPMPQFGSSIGYHGMLC